MSPSLALCFAHPDDEGYTSYASVALHHADPGFRLVVLHATDGGAGEIAPGVEVGPAGLGALRRIEDDLAWGAVGRRPDRHVWLDLQDGDVAQVPFEELVRSVAGFLDEERPDVVITFGPDGLTGHPDHVAVGRATDAAFHRVRGAGGPGLRRLLHVAIAQSWFDKHQRWRGARGKALWEPERLYHLRGVPDEQIGVDVRPGPVAHLVLAGLREHRSQGHVVMPADVEDEEFLRGTTHETHVMVWPVRRAGEPVLTDVFDDL